MIIIKNLCKTYGDREVLSDINLTVSKGQVVGIIGPSGSGKSTLLRCINRLEIETSGEILLGGTAHGDKTVLSKIGMVFQHFNLFPHMNIMENLIYAPIHAFAISRAEATGQARSLLSRVGLEARASNFPSQLSGGEKQRAAIARTLMINPEVILFDEPTSALDPEMVQEVLEVIKGLSHTSITIMLVTHEMSFARSVADRILFFDAGRLVEEGIPAEFFANPKTIRAQEFLNKVLR